MRVKIRSHRRMLRLAGGHKAAHVRHQRNQGHLAHIGALARHVGAGDDHACRLSSCPDRVSLGTKAASVHASRSTTGMAPIHE